MRTLSRASPRRTNVLRSQARSFQDACGGRSPVEMANMARYRRHAIAGLLAATAGVTGSFAACTDSYRQGLTGSGSGPTGTGRRRRHRRRGREGEHGDLRGGGAVRVHVLQRPEEGHQLQWRDDRGVQALTRVASTRSACPTRARRRRGRRARTDATIGRSRRPSGRPLRGPVSPRLSPTRGSCRSISIVERGGQPLDVENFAYIPEGQGSIEEHPV